MKRIIILTAIILSGLTVAAADTIDTGDDCSIVSWVPTEHFNYTKNICGEISHLRIAKCLIKFDLNAVNGRSSGEVHLVIAGRNPGSDFSLYEITEDWEAPTWETAPATGDYAGSFTVEAEEWVVITVDDINEYGWAIEGDAMGDLCQIYSFESSYRPYLVLPKTSVIAKSFGAIKAVYR